MIITVLYVEYRTENVALHVELGALHARQRSYFYIRQHLVPVVTLSPTHNR